MFIRMTLKIVIAYYPKNHVKDNVALLNSQIFYSYSKLYCTSEIKGISTIITLFHTTLFAGYETIVECNVKII
jgi:hypothetical protein